MAVINVSRKPLLVPIRVGMILAVLVMIYGQSACPHTHGDDPRANGKKPIEKNLSPYAWG